jgi:acyl-CoA synthetase (AMP-forming)/AMP-acid ligase II
LSTVSPTHETARAELAGRISAFIASGASGTSGDTHPTGAKVASQDTHLDSLLRDLAAFQAEHVEPYQRLCQAQDGRPHPLGWAPAMPTDVFRYTRVAAHPSSEDTHLFRTSGTTSGARGTHAFRDLALYDAAAEAHARRMLFPDVPRMALVMLAAHPVRVPESSLSYMLERFETWFGTGPATWCMRDDTLDHAALTAALLTAQQAGTPVALLGTSFAFVFAEDALDTHRFELPAGSRIMQTGGYKGRSREVEPATLRQLLSARYAIPEDFIVAEYGMTELSSQLYEASLSDRVAGHPQPRRHLVPPPWVRATPVDPETLAPVPQGQVGVLRIDDAANLDSVSAILTSDLASAARDGARGVDLHGRASGATLRGCSLAVEEALARGRD